VSFCNTHDCRQTAEFPRVTLALATLLWRFLDVHTKMARNLQYSTKPTGVELYVCTKDTVTLALPFNVHKGMHMLLHRHIYEMAWLMRHSTNTIKQSTCLHVTTVHATSTKVFHRCFLKLARYHDSTRSMTFHGRLHKITRVCILTTTSK
jgi:hypothetical protein